MSEHAFVSVTTDFGAAYTAICCGVVQAIAPAANVLVLSDEVTAYSVRHGAVLLRQALPYLPVGVHVGIVDPGVGTARREVAIETRRGDVLIGPDNGLLVSAAERLGGVTGVRLLTEPRFRAEQVSATFHGRDVFAPAAGHLAAGVPLGELGPPAGPGSLTALELPRPEPVDGALRTEVLYVDGFGSLVLAAGPDDLDQVIHGGPRPPGDHGAAVEARWRTGSDDHRLVMPFARTYGDVPVGDPLLFVDSSGLLAIAVNQGSAAERYGLAAGAELVLAERS